ncbi:MAG TPA: hypothetical protein VF736_05200, partial [Pyrinomonadaceae bacterium]
LGRRAGGAGAATSPGGDAARPSSAAAADGQKAAPDGGAVKGRGGASPASPGGTSSQAASTNDANVNAAPPPVPAAAAVVGSRRFDGTPAPRREYLVEVLVEVKGGRVTDARVWNPRPGASGYEEVALRMARERRYPEGFTGGERLRIRVRP